MYLRGSIGLPARCCASDSERLVLGWRVECRQWLGIQATAYGCSEALRIVRFGKKIQPHLQAAIFAEEMSAVAAGVDDLEARLVGPQFSGQLLAVQAARHDHIRK